jgi:hypothetical protein
MQSLALQLCAEHLLLSASFVVFVQAKQRSSVSTMAPSHWSSRLGAPSSSLASTQMLTVLLPLCALPFRRNCPLFLQFRVELETDCLAMSQKSTLHDDEQSGGKIGQRWAAVVTISCLSPSMYTIDASLTLKIHVITPTQSLRFVALKVAADLQVVHPTVHVTNACDWCVFLMCVAHAGAMGSHSSTNAAGYASQI